MHDCTLDDRVEALLRGPQYALPQAEKERLLLPLLRDLCRDLARRCPPYGRFLEHFGGDSDQWRNAADIPPLPVTMFKRFRLAGVPAEKIVRELQSSATTGQQPSRIFLDKTTAFRQARAVVAVLKEHVGGRRRPLLVLDASESAGQGASLSARGAAIRGMANFASESVFALRKLASGDVEPEWQAISAFFDRHSAGPLLIFGFTYLVWSRFVAEAQRRGLTFSADQAILLHSGGWKKLAAEAVSKDEFNRQASAVLGCPAAAILDFYGMVEQVGTVFVDCEAGNKHAPAFADVLIRRPYSLSPVAIGEPGIIEVLSTLPTSYPGHVLITEDQGVVVGEDDCPCGRKGRYFRFTRRIEQAEIRGCGDTFAQSRELR